jgi:hypothetical protein
MGTADQLEQANRANKLARQGIETLAQIDAMTETGNADATGSKEYEFALTVRPDDDRPSYAATTLQYIHPSARLASGQEVTVKVDPDDSGEVLVWGTA